MTLTNDEWAKIGKRLFSEWRNVEDEEYLEHYKNCGLCGLEGSHGEYWWEECDAYKYRDNGGKKPEYIPGPIDQLIQDVYGPAFKKQIEEEMSKINLLEPRFTVPKGTFLSFPIRKDKDD